MNGIPVSDVRNFVLLGHTGSGKTALVDALAHKLGINDRLGSTVSGSSIADYTDEEKDRKISIFAKSFSAKYKTSEGKLLNIVFCDTPGYMDFAGQVVAACSAAETAMILVDAASGIQVGTRRAWKRCQQYNLARAIVITGLDKDNTSFSQTLSDIQSAFGAGCVPVVLPKADGSGVVDVLAGKDVPADMAAEVDESKSRLVELAAETKDELIERFLAGGELTQEEISAGLESSVSRASLVPIFVCMPLKEIGIVELLDGAGRLFPPPNEREVKDADGNVIDASVTAPFVGFVWRSVNDPFVGQMTFVRVLGGTLKSDSEIYNTVTQQKERVGTIMLVNGKKQETVSEATAGDIVAIPKLKHTAVNQTLCSVGGTTVCHVIEFPPPVAMQAVHAKTQADEDKLGTALARVVEEDPTLHIVRDAATKQIVLQGLGDVHIDVAVGLMKSRSHVEVTLSVPKVPYRETVMARGEGHHKHKKQSGGRGQYGEVYLRVEPKKSEDEEWFVNAIVGGAIPGNFIPAIQKGLLDGMQAGAVAGYPVSNLKVTVYDGSYHDVDSSEIAFKIAGSKALRDAMANAKPVLLEPIMTARVSVPDHCMGDINGDLNHKRGRILGLESEDGMQVIVADVPQAELFRYAAELRSMTGGQGTYTMQFSRYEVVPQNVAQKIVAETTREHEEEEV